MKKYFIIVFLFFLIAAFIFFMPVFQKAETSSFFPEFEEEQINVFIDGKPIELENEILIVDNEIMLPINFIAKYIDESIFYDENNNVVITTEDKVIRMQTEEINYFVNHEPLNLNVPAMNIDDVAYLPIETFSDLFEIEVRLYDENILTIDFWIEEKKEASVLEKISLKSEAGFRNSYFEKIETGRVEVYDEVEEWYYVKSENGNFGYVLKEKLGEIETFKRGEREIVRRDPWKPENGKINMVWEQILNSRQNADEHRLVPSEGLDVISPTWFYLGNEEGDVTSIASKAYVDWAHGNGYQVWALFDNRFNATLTHNVLSDTLKREKVIKQILAYAAIYELDGINIDFEALRSETGPYYIQFMRELTPMLKKEGLVVSVDMYVPASWTRFYNRPVLGELVDYFIVMAYDEHWGTSPVSGSVASLPWVEKGIVETLVDVPAEKLILGVPYYTRKWKEEIIDGQLVVKPTSIGMTRSERVSRERNLELVWLEDIGQYYFEYEEGGARHRVWHEDLRSMGLRLDLVDKYDLAGIAGWRRGLELPDLWPFLEERLKSNN